MPDYLKSKEYNRFKKNVGSFYNTEEDLREAYLERMYKQMHGTQGIEEFRNRTLEDRKKFLFSNNNTTSVSSLNTPSNRSNDFWRAPMAASEADEEFKPLNARILPPIQQQQQPQLQDNIDIDSSILEDDTVYNAGKLDRAYVIANRTEHNKELSPWQREWRTAYYLATKEPLLLFQDGEKYRSLRQILNTSGYDETLYNAWVKAGRPAKYRGALTHKWSSQANADYTRTQAAESEKLVFGIMGAAGAAPFAVTGGTLGGTVGAIALGASRNAVHNYDPGSAKKSSVQSQIEATNRLKTNIANYQDRVSTYGDSVKTLDKQQLEKFLLENDEMYANLKGTKLLEGFDFNAVSEKMLPVFFAEEDLRNPEDINKAMEYFHEQLNHIAGKNQSGWIKAANLVTEGVGSTIEGVVDASALLVAPATATIHATFNGDENLTWGENWVAGIYDNLLTNFGHASGTFFNDLIQTYGDSWIDENFWSQGSTIGFIASSALFNKGIGKLSSKVKTEDLIQRGLNKYSTQLRTVEETAAVASNWNKRLAQDAMILAGAGQESISQAIQFKYNSLEELQGQIKDLSAQRRQELIAEYTPSLNALAFEIYTDLAKQNPDIPKEALSNTAMNLAVAELNKKIDAEIDDYEKDLLVKGTYEASRNANRNLFYNMVLLSITEGYGGLTTKFKSFKALNSNRNRYYIRQNKAGEVVENKLLNFASYGKRLGEEYFTEGLQENLQNIGDEMFTRNAEYNLLSYANNKYYGEGPSYVRDQAASGFDTYAKFFPESVGDAEIGKTWMQTAVGIGMGMPAGISRHRTSYKRKEGETTTEWLSRDIMQATPWQTPWLNELKAIRSERRQMKQEIAEMNKHINDPEAGSLIGGAPAVYNFQYKLNKAIQTGDEEAYENSVYGMLVSEALRYEGARQSKYVRHKVAQLEAMANIKQASKEDREEAVRAFREASVTNEYKNMSDDEIINDIEEHGKTMLKTYEKTIEAAQMVDDLYNGKIDEDTRRSIIFGKLAKENLYDRIKETQNQINNASSGIVNSVESRGTDSEHLKDYTKYGGILGTGINTTEEVKYIDEQIQQLNQDLAKSIVLRNSENPVDEKGNKLTKKQINRQIQAIKDNIKALTDRKTKAIEKQRTVAKALQADNILLSERDIMSLDADERSAMIANKRLYSKEQQKVIDNLINQGLQKDESFVKNIHRAGKQTDAVKVFERQYTEAIKHPEYLSRFIRNMKLKSFLVEKEYEYKKLNNIEDYGEFIKAYRLAEEAAIQSMAPAEALKLLVQTVEDNEFYKNHIGKNKELNKLIKSLKFSAYEDFSDEDKTKAMEVVKFLDDNNINYLDTEASVNYINENLDKFQETIGVDKSATNYIQKYNEIIKKYNEIETAKAKQAEEERKLREALENPKPVVNEKANITEPTQTQEVTPEEESKTEELPENTPDTEYDMTENESYLEYAKRVVPKEYYQYIELLNSYDESLVMPFTLMIKSTLSAEVLQLKTSQSQELFEEVKENLRQFFEELMSENRGSAYEYLNTALSLITTKYGYLNRPTPRGFLQNALDTIPEEGEEINTTAVTNEMQKIINATSTSMTMANVVQGIEGVLGKQYTYYGIDDFLFYTKDPYLVKLRQDKKTKVQYVVLGKDIRDKIHENMGDRYIPDRDLPIAAVVEVDATEAERIKEDARNNNEEKYFIEIEEEGTKHYYQPIGFVINSNSNANGGNMARVIRRSANEQFNSTDKNNPYLVKHNNEALYTTGVTIKGNSPFSQKSNNLKDLVQQALKTSSNGFWRRFAEGLRIAAQEDKRKNIQQGITSLYYTFYNGKRGKSSKDTFSKLQIIVKPLYLCTNKVGKTLQDVIFNGSLEDFINFHQRDNGTQGRMYKGIKAVVDIANKLEGENLIVSSSDKNQGEAAQKRINDIWSAFKDYIYLDYKNYPFKTKSAENGDIYIYVEVNNDEGTTREIKLFTVRHADGTSIKIDQVAAELREAMKDRAMAKHMHFQLNHHEAIGGMEPSDDETKEKIRIKNAADYMREVVEDNIAEIRAYSLSPTYLPETYMTNGTYIQEQTREFNAAERKPEASTAEQITDTTIVEPESTTDPEIKNESENTTKPPQTAESSSPEESILSQKDLDDLLDLRETTEQPTRLWDRQKELDWLKRVLPQLSREDLIKFQEGLLRIRQSGKTAWGKFDGAMMVISDFAAEGTVYHEAFHVVFNAILDASEQEQILAEARLKYGEELTNEALEEALAEDFREYAQAHNKKSWTNKIRNFFDELLTKVIYWTTGRNKIPMLFQNINKGKFSDKELKLMHVKEEVNVREKDFQIEFDETGEFKNTESFINAVLETVLGYRDEHLAKLLTDSVSDEVKFESILNEALNLWDDNLYRAMNNAVSRNLSISGDVRQKEKVLAAIEKYENNQKLTKVEEITINKLIEKARKENNLDWINSEKARLQSEINISNSDRLIRLEALRRMAARAEYSANQNFIEVIKKSMIQQRENIAKHEFKPEEIAAKLNVTEVANEVRNVRFNVNQTTSLGQSKEAIDKLKEKGISLIEYQTLPVELQERIKQCCNF